MQPLTIPYMREKILAAYHAKLLIANHPNRSVTDNGYFYRSEAHEGVACAIGACLPSYKEMPERFQNEESLVEPYDADFFVDLDAYYWAVRVQYAHDSWSNEVDREASHYAVNQDTLKREAVFLDAVNGG